MRKPKLQNKERMMYSTVYVNAKDIGDAVSHLTSADDGKLLAGGMTLIPTLKQRLANPDKLVDLANCGLSGIEDEGESLRIGAMTRHADVAGSDIVQKAIPAVADLANHIGDRQVRNRGTIGGSVANNDPSACYPSAVLALGGTVHTQNRSIAAEDFFTGMFDTALDEDEVITAISLPKPEKAAYMKFPNPASRYAMVGVFVAKFADGVRVAVTGAGDDGVFRATDLEAALDKEFSASAVDDVAISDDGLMSDIHASADYRAHLIAEMTRRAVSACG
jgi:carbon-monoxide dehydrogenase medium subunit